MTGSGRASKGAGKFAVERLIGRWVANPAVAALGRLGVRTTFASRVETTGRKSGAVRTVPLSAAFDDDGAWVISQHGRRSGWALNIAANPNVRIQRDGEWLDGVARFVPDDDPVARARTFAASPKDAGLVAAGFRVMQSTDPISVRIDFVT